VALHGHRNGIPFADLIPAKTATPTFDLDGAVMSVEVRYPYVEEYQEPASGTWKYRVKLYRRTIDDKLDTTFQPADADPSGREPKWVPDKTRTIRHGLGFCPIVWYAFMKGCVPINVFDGKALHADHTDEIHQHDIAVSQRHRCALFSEPQICETGVEKGSSPTEMGQTPVVQSSEHGGRLVEDRSSAGSSTNPLTGGYGKAKASAGPQEGPGYVWQYENSEAGVFAIIIPSRLSSFRTTTRATSCTRSKSRSASCFPSRKTSSTQRRSRARRSSSWKARQLDRCDQYRDDLRDNFPPSVNVQLRIASVLGSTLKVSGADQVATIIAKLQEPEVPRAVGPRRRLASNSVLTSSRTSTTT
jgi:hypothetical protein